MPGFGSGGPVNRWDRSLLVWHALFYGTLGVATVSALATPASTSQVQLAAGMSLLLAVWYAYWMVLRQNLMFARAGARVLYFAVFLLVWAGLLATDRDYGILAFAAYPHAFGYLGWPHGLVGAGAITLLLTGAAGLAGGLGAPGGLQWVGFGVGDLIDPLLVMAVVTLLFLWIRDIIRQSTGRQRLIDELESTREGLAAAERAAGVLQERQRLAAEIHDTLTQELASIVMLLEGAQASLAAGSSSGVDHVEQALRSARESLREIRRLVWSLRPEALERGSLAQALDRLASELSTQTGIAARCVVTGQPLELPREAEVTLLRAAQEALANVRRHSGAGDVTLTLSYMDDVVVLDVRDDGSGFDPDLFPVRPRMRGGLGLLGMRERVEGLGGALTLESEPGEGTTIVVAVPVQPTDAPAPSVSSDAATR